MKAVEASVLPPISSATCIFDNNLGGVGYWVPNNYVLV